MIAKVIAKVAVVVILLAGAGNLAGCASTCGERAEAFTGLFGAPQQSLMNSRPSGLGGKSYHQY